jgi:tetratricopeptide (TPR) repeat protein
MIRIPLGGSDAADRAQFLQFCVRFGVPAFVLLSMGECTARTRDWIGPGTLFALLVLNVPAIVVASGMMYSAIEKTAQSFSQTVLGAGNLPPVPAHSGLESLVARGLYREAVNAFQRYLTDHPGDNLARIKLADVHHRYLGEPEAAERLYLEVRRNHPDPRHEFLAWNLLIELYRSTGRNDRLMVELARFADRYRHTQAGRQAARSLQELKAELPRNGA